MRIDHHESPSDDESLTDIAQLSAVQRILLAQCLNPVIVSIGTVGDAGQLYHPSIEA